MPSPKHQYIQRIRAQSAYPTFRWLVRVAAILIYVAGGLAMLAATNTGVGLLILEQSVLGWVVLLCGPLVGLVFFVVGRVTQEAASILADIADSITDLNSRSG
jgi:hypothetical protein